MERNRIYNEDCLKILNGIPDESVDLIIADPPYYRMKGSFDFAFHTEKGYLDWCNSWVKECHRILKSTGAFYCWGSGLMIDKLSVQVLDCFAWEKRNLIVWDYATGRPGKAAYRYETEFLWFYSKPLHRINHDAIRIPYFPGQEKDKRKNPKGKTCGNVWRFPRVVHNAKEATGHPTQKPEQLSERMILASSNPKDLVFIPFAGSGSEILSCIKANRDFIAAEINTQYVNNMILPRIKKVLSEGGKTMNPNIEQNPISCSHAGRTV